MIKSFIRIVCTVVIFIIPSTTAAAPQYANPLKHAPYVQLGDAPLVGFGSSATDQFQIIWQTIPDIASTSVDTFNVDYKLTSTSTWTSANFAATSTINTGVSNRVNHYVDIKGLLYDTDYDYRVQHIRDGSVLATYSATYHTRLDAGSNDPFTFVAYGDSASGNPPTRFMNVQTAINNIDPAFAVLLGDNVYTDGTHTEWDLRLDQTINAPAAAFIKNRIDFFGWGNHDIVSANGQPAIDNYDNPKPVLGVTSGVAAPVGETPEKNYSFDYGNVHFVTLDSNSYTDATRLDKQLVWAKADLASSSAKWKIVFVHFPIVSVSFTSTGPSSNYYKRMIAELQAGGADALFVGHAHSYERSFPMIASSTMSTVLLSSDTNDNDYAKGSGLTEIVSGVAGRDFHGGTASAATNWLVFGQTSASTYNRFGSTPAAVADGFTKIDVTSNQLTITQIKSSDGSTVDSFTITAGISATNIQPASLVAGVTGNVLASFTNSSSIPSDGKIILTLPKTAGDGFVADSGGSTTVASSTMSGSFSVATATTSTSTIITLTRSGGSATGIGAQTITLTNIKNPNITGSTGVYGIKTQTSGDVVIEEDNTVSADTITPGVITGANVQPASLNSSTVGQVAVSLTTTNSLPADGKIVVTFPTSLGGGFAFNSGGSTAASSITGIDGSLSVSIASNVITLTRSGGTAFATGTISFNLSNIQNPTIGGSTGVYQVKTTTNGGVNIDQDSSVAADTIAGGSSAPWWNANWQNRVKIYLDNSGQASNATSVPVMIALNDSRIDYADILSAGADIRFVDSDNATALSYEIEKWDTNGTSTIWVKVPDIAAATSSDYIYMYYTNAVATDGQNVSDVWSNNYAAVYHFAETTGAYFDSVSNHVNNNSDSQTVTSRTATLLGNAPSFNGTAAANYITIPDANTFNFTHFTAEAFVKSSGAGTTVSSGGQPTIYPIFTKGIGEGDTAAQDIHFFLGLRTDARIGTDFEDSTVVTNNAAITGASTLSVNGTTPYYIANAVQAGSGGSTKIYVDGVVDATSSLPVSGQNGLTPNVSGTQKVGIGTAVNTSNTVNGAFNGIIDEVRISTTTRSADWLALQNKSIKDTLATYDSVENISSLSSLTSASVTPASLTVGSAGDVTIAFTTTTDVPADGKIVVTFPTSLGSGFTFNSGGATAVSSSSGFTGSFSSSIASNVITLTRSGGAISTPGAKTIVLTNIQNPNVAGSTGLYALETRTSGDATIDDNSVVTASTIVAGGLFSTNVEPASAVVSSTGSVTVTFSTINAIPADGKIVVTFPTSLGGGFTFNSGGATAASSETMGGSLSVGIASNVVTITRSGGLATAAGETESITLTNIQNPNSTGSTGLYQIKTTNSANITIDEDTTVGSDTITSAGAASGWWNNSWAYRKKITFNNGSINTNLVDFPVRVALATSSTTYGNFKANGDDVRFIDADGVTQLNYEIENWNTASSSNLWVKIPQIDSASTTDHVYMYYGNPGATAVATTTGVWDSNYVAVHHFGSTSAATYTDSTSRGNNSDAIVSVTRSAVTGAAGNAVTFTGGSGTSYITLPDSNDYDMTSYTIEAFVRQAGAHGLISTGTGGQTSIGPVVAKGMAEAESQVADVQFFMGVTASTAGADFENSIATAGGIGPSGNAPVSATSTVTTGTWYHLAQRYNYQEINAATSTHNMYKNGYQEGSIQTGYRPSVQGTMKVGISVAPKTSGVTSGGGFNGTIDEVRISNVARSAGWISASNLSTANSYNAVSSEESAGAGELTVTNVEPVSLVSGATGEVVVSFTTENNVPSDGKIVVTFPTSLGTGFGLNSGTTTAVSTSTNIDGALAVSTAGNVVTITRSGGTVLSDGAKSITLTGIRNPNSTGSTGTYQIKTTDSSNVIIDQDSAVAADTITLATMSATNVQPGTLAINSSDPVTVSFTTTNSIPANGKIVVTLPTTLGAGFMLGNVAIQGTPTGINGSFTVATSSNTVTITRTGNGNVSTAGAKSIVLTGITTPNTAGSTGVYQIKTTNSSNVTIDQDTAVTADLISGGLSSANVEPASLVAGAVGNVVVSFTPEAEIPANGKIKIVFPATLGGGFTLDSGSLTGVTASSGFDGSLSVSTTTNTIIITRSGGSAAAAGAKSITLTNIKNPTIPGFTGVYTIQTLTSSDDVIDQNVSVAQDEITVGSLTSTNIQPASLVASTVGNVTVAFTTANPIPVDGRMYVYMPISLGDGYLIDSGATTTLTSLTGIDGTVTLSATNNYINIVRSGDGTISTPGAKSFVLTNIKNPNIAGSTGLYTIETRTASAITIDEDLSVAADTITSAGGGDVTPPVISAVASTTSVTAATTTWTTDEVSSSKVHYGTVAGTYTASSTAASSTSHVVGITGLSASTRYYFIVVSADASGNTATSTEYSFTTLAVPDTTAPNLSNIASSTTAYTATVQWDTNESANGQLDYGLTSGYGIATTSASLTSSKSFTLTGLMPNTIYHFRITALDGASNSTTSADYVFKTIPDTIGPVISNVSVTASLDGASITWSTDENATSSVSYGTSTAYGSTSTSSANTSHSVSITGLTEGLLQHYQIYARDLYANVTTTVDATFTTLVTQAASPAPVGPLGGGGGGSGGGVVIAPPVNLPVVPVPGCPVGFVCVANPLAPLQPQNVAPNIPNQALGKIFENMGKAGIVIKNIQSQGRRNIEIVNIQKILNADPATQVAPQGPGSPGKETNLFGIATRAAVQKFQLKYGIVKSPRDTGYGVVGPKTKAKMNELLSKKN